MMAHVRDYNITHLETAIALLGIGWQTMRKLDSSVVSERSIKHLREIIDDLHTEKCWQEKARGIDAKNESFSQFLESLIIVKEKQP